MKSKPNFKLLGPKLGKKIKSAKAVIEALDDESLREYKIQGKLIVNIDGEDFELSGEELEIETIDKDNFAVESDNGFRVAVSTLIPAELILEGYARELVNKIQNMRKSADFQVTDRINVSISSNDEFKKALEKHGDYIKTETLADDISLTEIEGDLKQEWDINGQPATIIVSRITK